MQKKNIAKIYFFDFGTNCQPLYSDLSVENVVLCLPVFYVMSADDECNRMCNNWPFTFFAYCTKIHICLICIYFISFCHWVLLSISQNRISNAFCLQESVLLIYHFFVIVLYNYIPDMMTKSTRYGIIKWGIICSFDKLFRSIDA